jgi:GntR family transcriptional regulator, transcriptional repressor for pyruvate dehydrogenase complex
MRAPERSSLRVDRVRTQRLADAVADQIRELILSGDLPDGGRLPPLDRQLEQFGVSAPTMREALRILEAEGLLSVQRGGIGGALVRQPTPKTAAYTLALVLRGQGVAKGDVSQAIKRIEPTCAMLCARRADRHEAVLPELRALHEASAHLLDGDGVAFNDVMLGFHRALVRLSGNETLTLLNQALEDILLVDVRTWVAATDAEGNYPTAAVRQSGLDTHERIIDLIAHGDEWAVGHAMAEHIEDGVVRDVVDPTQRVDPKAVRART